MGVNVNFSEFISESKPTQESLAKWIESQKFDNDRKGFFKLGVEFKDINDDFVEIHFDVKEGTGSTSYKGELAYGDVPHILDTIKKKFAVKFDQREFNDYVKYAQKSNTGRLTHGFNIRVLKSSLS